MSITKDKFEIILSLVDHLDAMVAYWDRNQVCVFANEAYRSWFGVPRDEVIGHTMQELLGPIYPKNLPFIHAALAGQRQVFEREIPTQDGNIRYSLATYTPHVVGGVVQGMFVHVADVTLLKQLEHELRDAKKIAEDLALHDFLTGLPNRMYMLDRLPRAIAEAEHKREMLAILSIDTDNFKEINDTCGHAEGDRFLIEIAARLGKLVRGSDTIARMGGDEFLLLETGLKSAVKAEKIAERLLSGIKETIVLGDAARVPTISIGIAIYPQFGTTTDILLAADRALYTAKKLGKDRFAFAA